MRNKSQINLNEKLKLFFEDALYVSVRQIVEMKV